MADGTPVDVAAATAGEPTLINVWATWCAPCRKELPALQEYSQRPGAVRVLGVQVQSGQAGGLELLDSLGDPLAFKHWSKHYPSRNEVRYQTVTVPNSISLLRN